MRGIKQKRSRLPRSEARQRYVEIGELAALKQIKSDAKALDNQMIAIGPFARLDAGAVAARDGKTRGAITNLFGSQSAFQGEIMALALNAGEWIDRIEFADPAAFASADAWLDAFFAGESARGPRHRATPVVNYSFLWALWLSAVPYGMWSAEISKASFDEHRKWVERLEDVVKRALEHFGMTLRKGTTINDLACAIATLVEGAWLNQCLTTRHPCDPAEPIATLLLRAGRLLWLGATEPPSV